MLIITLHNDGTGDVRTGNYDYVVRVNDNVLERGHIEGHMRGQGWQQLVSMLLKNSVELNRLAMLETYAAMLKEEADELRKS